MIKGPAAHVKGRAVRVTGLVRLSRDRPETIVKETKQVVVADKE
jgi:DNA/RNA endonuclease YhcR with UshA esterase domain